MQNENRTGQVCQHTIYTTAERLYLRARYAYIDMLRAYYRNRAGNIRSFDYAKRSYHMRRDNYVKFCNLHGLKVKGV